MEILGISCIVEIDVWRVGKSLLKCDLRCRDVVVEWKDFGARGCLDYYQQDIYLILNHLDDRVE